MCRIACLLLSTCRMQRTHPIQYSSGRVSTQEGSATNQMVACCKQAWKLCSTQHSSCDATYTVPPSVLPALLAGMALTVPQAPASHLQLLHVGIDCSGSVAGPVHELRQPIARFTLACTISRFLLPPALTAFPCPHVQPMVSWYEVLGALSL